MGLKAGKMTLKAVFFDMDGVLVCSEKTHFQAWKELMTSFEVELPDTQFFFYVGGTDIFLAIELTKIHGLLIDPKELCKRKRDVFLAMIGQGFAVPKGRNEFLEEIHGRFQLAVVSSASRREIDAILTIENISHYFDFIIGNEDTARHKPDPLPYITALQKSALTKKEALVIEDSHPGISAAILAGLNVLGISSTFSCHPDFPEVCFYQDFIGLREDEIFHKP